MTVGITYPKPIYVPPLPIFNPIFFPVIPPSSSTTSGGGGGSSNVFPLGLTSGNKITMDGGTVVGTGNERTIEGISYIDFCSFSDITPPTPTLGEISQSNTTMTIGSLTSGSGTAVNIQGSALTYNSNPVIFTNTLTNSTDITGNVLNLQNYTQSQIIGSPLIGSSATIMNAVLIGTAVGNGIVNCNNTIAIGNNSAYSTVSNTNGISIGTHTDLGTGFTNNIAIGYGCEAMANNAVQIGGSTSLTQNPNANSVQLGDSNMYVSIPNYIKFADGTQLSSANLNTAGITTLSLNSSTTSWEWNLTSILCNAGKNIPFTVLLATNVPSLASQVYTGDYTLIPQQVYFTVSSPVLQNTNVENPPLTNANAQQMPVSLTGFYANGMNVVQMTGVNSRATVTFPASPFGAVFYDNETTTTLTSTSPFQPAFTGIASLTTTTFWYGTYYLVQTSYNFVPNNIANGYTLNTFFTEPTYSTGVPTSIAGIYMIVNTSVGTPAFTNPVNLQLNIV